MGYSIAIGQRKVYDDGGSWVCAIDHLSEAPLSSVGNGDRGNCICPSYSAWDGFLRRAGLYDLCPARAGRGVQPVTGETVRRLEAAALLPLQGIDRVRVRWLVWWARWALAHCDDPVWG